MANPLSSTWRSARQVLHPLEMALLVGIATIFVGLWLWLPTATALITIGTAIAALSIAAYAIAAEQGR